ncbi:MAG: head decoration protein [Vicinamibacterales bacterium]
MSTKTEGRHAAEFLVSESPGSISRDEATVTVAATTTLKAGMVLGRLTATGKYVPYDNAGSDGSEAAYGVLLDEVANATGAPVDVEATVINWGAEVRYSSLEWASGLVDADKDAAAVDLLARGIKVRT